MKAEDKLREFCALLDERGTNRTTIATKYHAPVKSFFSYNALPLKLKTPKHVKQQRQPHTVEEIKTLMKLGDVRERAIMMFLKDSGISREDVVTLKYGDIQQEFEQGKEVVHISLVRQKEQVNYDTFVGRNALEHLQAYLEYRKQIGEKIKENSPLLASLDGRSLRAETLSAIFFPIDQEGRIPNKSTPFQKIL